MLGLAVVNGVDLSLSSGVNWRVIGAYGNSVLSIPSWTVAEEASMPFCHEHACF